MNRVQRMYSMRVMRSWIRNHVSWSIGVLAFIATILGALAGFVPELRGWFEDQALLGWLVGLVGITVAIVIWMRWDSDSEASKRAIANRDSDIADLTKRLHPTKRDLSQFNSILDALPWGTGILGWLEMRFTAKKWWDSDSDPLYDLHEQWREWFFDDSDVQDAFVDLYDAMTKLVEWLSAEGGGSATDDPGLNTIVSGSSRPDGWPEYNATRKEGLRRKSVLLESRRAFERVGRRRGL